MTQTTADKVRAHLRIYSSLPEPSERRRLRVAAGMSKETLAEIVGCTAPAIRGWESGAHRPTPTLAAKYLEALETLREAEQQNAGTDTTTDGQAA